MKKFGKLWITTTAYFIGVVILSIFITQALNDYRAKKEQIAAELNFEKRLMNAWEWVPGNTIGEGKVALWGKLEMEASAHYGSAVRYSLLLGLILMVYVTLNILFYKDKPGQYQVFGLVMIFCSMSFLFLAVQSPFLEVMAYSRNLAFEVPLDVNFDEMDFIGSLGLGEFQYNYEQVFEGRIYYLYQNKSVLELIKLLFTGGNFAVAILVIIVTLIFPFFKFIFSIIVLLRPNKTSSKRIYKSIRNLGKWSMMDVFTTAILLAHFAYTNMNSGVDTGSETLIGLYYFLIFVALSINSGQYLKKAMHSAQQIEEGELD